MQAEGEEGTVDTGYTFAKVSNDGSVSTCVQKTNGNSEWIHAEPKLAWSLQWSQAAAPVAQLPMPQPAAQNSSRPSRPTRRSDPLERSQSLPKSGKWAENYYRNE